MNSFLKKFHDVVEMGKEVDAAHSFCQASQISLTSSDPAVLRGHIATLTQQLARQVQSYEELRGESMEIEKVLARLRMRFAASRELWETANEHLEVVIQNLLEHQLFDDNVSPSHRTGAEVSSNSLDAIYVASLYEQIQRLKEMVQRSGDERTQLRCQKYFEQTQILVKSSGAADSVLEADVRQALEKMVLHWEEERVQYETIIENLEQHVARHTEREELLSYQIKREKELRENAVVTVEQHRKVVEELRVVQAELEEVNRGARAGAHVSAAPVALTSPDLKPRSSSKAKWAGVGHDGKEQVAAQGNERTATLTRLSAAASIEGTRTGDSSSLPCKTAVDGAAVHSSTPAADSRAFHEQQAELEQLRQDYRAREEALDSLYADNKSFQEALQGAEVQARQFHAALQDCQRRQEELHKQLTRERQKTEQLEVECEKSAAVQAKLRDQVRDLRRALTAAAAASDHDAIVPHARSAKIPGVPVGRPTPYAMAEHAITYEGGGKWCEWAVEAGRCWEYLSGNAVPLRAPLATSGGDACGMRARGTLAPRRGPRVLLLFACIMGVITVAFLFLVVMESMYAAFRFPEAP
ncbi:hypothetical protein ABL78_0094 [Leptomonas seymouri]|uniref:Uncharacterized protein n=1 Tax=Leptomonas seymouri TaxID=5684 RepID=A0A0N1I4B6_LEPSE|nr:hypothetical protein ABL78_0094 [Leptomonas seymouri]|eukprot:KPI90861.1 hypothetical protein ABL78_0094 [Leptomonas seymouri]